MPEDLEFDITFAFEKCICVFENPILPESGWKRNNGRKIVTEND